MSSLASSAGAHTATRTAARSGLDGAELTRLYLELAGPLRRRLAAAVRASQLAIEDACQFAWGQLVRHRDRVQPEMALPWLLTTAMREALKLARLEGRELSLETELELRGDCLAALPEQEPHELVQLHERLARVRELPPRQQRIVWLKALGLSRFELAAREHCTNRTVERQLALARSRLRAGANRQ